jgi:hypothetical protein
MKQSNEHTLFSGSLPTARFYIQFAVANPFGASSEDVAQHVKKTLHTNGYHVSGINESTTSYLGTVDARSPDNRPTRNLWSVDYYWGSWMMRSTPSTSHATIFSFLAATRPDLEEDSDWTYIALTTPLLSLSRASFEFLRRALGVLERKLKPRVGSERAHFGVLGTKEAENEVPATFACRWFEYPEEEQEQTFGEYLNRLADGCICSILVPCAPDETDPEVEWPLEKR